MNHKILTLLLLLTTALPALAADDPAAAYEAYFNAVRGATSVSQLTPHYTKAQAEEVDKASAAEQAMMLDLMQSFLPADYKVVNSEVSGDTASLNLMPSDSTTTGTITLKKEDGAWKIDRESWKSEG